MKKILFCFLVLLGSVLIVILNFKFYIFAGGDSALMVNPESFLGKSIFAWDYNMINMLGAPATGNIPAIVPLFGFFSIFSFLPNLIVEYGYFSLVFFGIFTGSFIYFKNYLFKNTFVCLTASLLYLFNNFFFVQFININTQMSFLVLPVLLILSHKIMENNYRQTILYIVISSLFIPLAMHNQPNGMVVFFIAGIYFAYLFIKEKKYQNLFPFLTISFFSAALILLINFWWLFPTAYFLFGTSLGKVFKESVIEFFSTTSVFDAFRFMGGWAQGSYSMNLVGTHLGWLYLKNVIFIFISYLLVGVSILSFLFIKKDKRIIFFFLLYFIGLSLSKGDLPPFGNLYYSAWQKIPGMIAFREPYTKFTIISVFAFVVLFGFFINYLLQSVGKKSANIIKLGTLIFIIVNAVPFIIGGFVPNGGNAETVRSYLTKVPSYLYEIEKYTDNKKMDYRILIFPKAGGGRYYNWESGFSLVNSPLIMFSHKYYLNLDDYRLIKGSGYQENLYTNIENITNYIGQNKKVDDKISGYLNLFGILNVKEFVQENDLDWRWQDASLSTRSPLEMEKMFSILESQKIISKVKQFGLFDQKYLDKIPNNILDYWVDGRVLKEEEKKYLKDLLPANLLNKPASVIYEINSDYYWPHIYTANDISFLSGSKDDFFNYILNKKAGKTFVVYLQEGSQSQPAFDLFEKAGFDKTAPLPVIEYKRINPSKYRILIHKADSVFPIVFSENYDKRWNLFVNKISPNKLNENFSLEGYNIIKDNQNDQASPDNLSQYVKNGNIEYLGDGKNKIFSYKDFTDGAERVVLKEKYKIGFVSAGFKGTIQNENLLNGNPWETWDIFGSITKKIDEKNHAVANGFANSWIIDTKDVCKTGFCRHNSDGSYDIELIMEYGPQKMLYLCFLLSIATFLITVLYLLFGLKTYFVGLKK